MLNFLNDDIESSKYFPKAANKLPTTGICCAKSATLLEPLYNSPAIAPILAMAVPIPAMAMLVKPLVNLPRAAADLFSSPVFAVTVFVLAVVAVVPEAIALLASACVLSPVPFCPRAWPIFSTARTRAASVASLATPSPPTLPIITSSANLIHLGYICI